MQAAVPPRFRCVVCRVFVTGTIDGVCPRCGWRPPEVTVRRGPRVIAIAPWVVVAAAAGVIAVVLALVGV